MAFTRLGEVLRERTGLLERVEEALVADGHEQPGACDALLQRVPLLLGEVRLACHVPSSNSGADGLAEVHARERALEPSVEFLPTKASVEIDVLRHRDVRVQLQLGEAAAPRLVL